MTLASSCRGFGRTFHSTVPNLDAKEYRWQHLLAALPKASESQLAALQAKDAIRRRAAARRKLVGTIYNAMSKRLAKRFKNHGITQEQYWDLDDALWDKAQRLEAKIDAIRDARIASVDMEAAQS